MIFHHYHIHCLYNTQLIDSIYLPEETSVTPVNNVTDHVLVETTQPSSPSSVINGKNDEVSYL